MDLKREHINKGKIFFIPVYLFAGVGIIVWLGSSAVFYEVPKESLEDWPRWLACVAFSFIGFAILIGMSVRTHINDLSFSHSYIWKFRSFFGRGRREGINSAFLESQVMRTK